MNNLRIVAVGWAILLGSLLGAGTFFSATVAADTNILVGCAAPISDADFKTMVASLEALDFESEKVDFAKKEISSKCLSAKQLKDLVLYFDFETTKLDIAKYAYTYAHDPANFNTLYDAFEFTTSVDELKKHIGQ